MADALSIAGTFIVMAISLFIAVLIYLRRKLYPLSARLPALSILSLFNVVTLLFSVLLARASFGEVPCVISWGLIALNFCTFLCIYSIRAWSLLFRSEISVNLDQLKEVKRQSLQPAVFGWYLKHRRFVSRQFLFKLLGAHTAFVLLFLLIGIPFNSVLRNGESCGLNFDDGKTEYVTLMGIVMFLHGGFYFWCSFKLRMQVPDGYGIRQELKNSAILLFVFALFYVLATQLIHDSTVFSRVQLLANILTLIVWMSLMGIIPLYRSYLKLVEPVDDISIDNVLRSSTWCQGFLEFLKTEFSSENLLFWQAVETYKATLLSTQERLKVARDLMQRYIVPEAPCEVNFPGVIKNDLIKQMAQLEETYGNSQPPQASPTTERGPDEVELIPLRSSSSGPSTPSRADEQKSEELSPADDKLQNLFDVAQREVRRLMEDDSFHRFRMTTTYNVIKSHYMENERAEKEKSTTRPSIVVELSDNEIINSEPSSTPLEPRSSTGAVSIEGKIFQRSSSEGDA